MLWTNVGSDQIKEEVKVMFTARWQGICSTFKLIVWFSFSRPIIGLKIKRLLLLCTNVLQTLPEAQRTQGIEFICNLSLISLSLAFVWNLVIRWCFLHSKVGQQVESLALQHCLGLLCWLVLIRYLHQPESHQLSLQNVAHLLRDNQTHRSHQETWVLLFIRE